MLATLAELRFAETDRLEVLDLSGSTPVRNILFFVPAIHGLQDLTLARTGIGDDHLQTLPKLKHLVLDGNAIRGPGLEALVKQSELAELSLAGAGLADEDLTKLPKLPKLRRLVLDENPIRGPALSSLKEQPELVDLSLGSPTFTDLFAKDLAELKRLKRLSLVGTSVTDAAITHLESMTNLEQLDLRQTKVTKEGVARLEKALPKCKITCDRK